MRAVLAHLTSKLWWLLITFLGDNAVISFGRGMSLLLTLYFCGQDAWFFHKTRQLVDNATLITQGGLMTMFFFQTKLMPSKNAGTDPEGKS